MKCLWFGSENSSPSNSATNYQLLNASTNWGFSAAEYLRQNLIGENITVTAIRIKLEAAPGVGKSRTITLRDDAVDTAATLTIADSATTGSWTGSVAIGIGSFASLAFIPSGTPDSAVGVGIEVEYETAGDFYIIPGNGQLPYDSGRYQNIYSGNPGSSYANATDVEMVVPTDITVTKFSTAITNHASISGSMQLSIRKNSTSDELTNTLSGSTVSTSQSGGVDLVPGDTIAIRSSPSSPTTTAEYIWCLTVSPDTVGEFIAGYGTNSSGSTSVTQYEYAHGGGVGWNATEANRDGYFPNLEFKKLYAKVINAPGGSATRVFTLRDNGSDTALTATISGANTTGNNTASTVTHSGALGSFSHTPTSTPASSGGVKLGYVYMVPQGGDPPAEPAFVPRVMFY